jgi:replicative DNA helicase
MAEPKKLTERASELADQAAQAAGPALERAKEVAAELAEKAGPAIERAAEKAGPVLERAAERAAELAAQGVSVAAEQLDKATKGKYSDKISTVSAKIEDALDREK